MANQDNDNGFEPLDMDIVANQEGQLKVVMCGKVQTGKSSLINSLAGTEVAKEYLSPKDQSIKCNAYGTQVTIHDGQQKKTINVLLWDSPGLGGAFGNNEENLHQVVEKAKETDLLVYCLDMHADEVGAGRCGWDCPTNKLSWKGDVEECSVCSYICQWYQSTST